MPENKIPLHVDYAENYENKQQGECHSAYFGRTSFSIFTAAAYIRFKEKTEEIRIVRASEAKDHFRIASHSCILKAVEMITIRYPHLGQFGSLYIHLWSDGYSVQFRYRFVFQLTTLFPSRTNVNRYYKECQDGKGSVDSIGGSIKSAFYRAVRAEKLLYAHY